MVNTIKLIEFVKNSQISEEQKKTLMPVIQVADEDTKKQIYFKIKEFEDNLEKIRQGKMPLSPEIAKYAEEKTKQIRTQARKQGEKITRDYEEQEAEKELQTLLSK